MTQTVHVTGDGVEYTWPTTLTETKGADISADPVQISLGTSLDPGTWETPDVLTRPTASSVTVQKLIDATVQPGDYWVWVKVTDDPEVVPRLGHHITVR